VLAVNPTFLKFEIVVVKVRYLPLPQYAACSQRLPCYTPALAGMFPMPPDILPPLRTALKSPLQFCQIPVL